MAANVEEPVVPTTVDEILAHYGEDNIQHLYGNLYRVRFSEIKLAPQGFDPDAAEFEFGNPRWHMNAKGKMIAHGLNDTKEKAIALKNAIQEEGLENPLRLRIWHKDGEIILESVNGERRYRQLDALIKEKADCIDAETGEETPASELYEFVEARINSMDDMEALEYATRPNETGEPIGERAMLNVVRVLRKHGANDTDIRRKSGDKSVTWLRETDSLIGLNDDSVLDALDSNAINRKVALDLTKIADAGERGSRLGSLIAAATARTDAIKEKTRAAADKADEEAEIAEAEHREATLLGTQEDQDSTAATATTKRTKAAKKGDDAKVAANASTTATTKDLTATANPDNDGDPGNKPLTISKLEKHWQGELASLIRRKGTDEEGNELDLDLEDAKLAKMIVDAILNGKQESDGKTPISTIKLLKQHARNKAKRAQ